MTPTSSHTLDFDAHPSEARPLLSAFLSSLACYQHTPLDFEIDYAAILSDACRELGFAHPPPPSTVVLFDRLVSDALGLIPPHQPQPRPLASWLESCSRTLRPVDPMAFDILRLAIDGCLPGEIAQRLEIGPLLVQRLVSDVASAWQNRTNP